MCEEPVIFSDDYVEVDLLLDLQAHLLYLQQHFKHISIIIEEMVEMRRRVDWRAWKSKKIFLEIWWVVRGIFESGRYTGYNYNQI